MVRGVDSFSLVRTPGAAPPKIKAEDEIFCGLLPSFARLGGS
jgi:hypothetical protein